MEIVPISLEWTIPLFLFFNKTNYGRFAPLFQQDCLKLESDFPELYKHFLEGGFAVRKTSQKGSVIPMNQALEQHYNKPAKRAGGITGYTRRKENLALWNLIKQEKELFVSFLESNSNRESEYTIHHEFTEHSARESAKDVHAISEYIEKVGNTLTESFIEKPISKPCHWRIY